MIVGALRAGCGCADRDGRHAHRTRTLSHDIDHLVGISSSAPFAQRRELGVDRTRHAPGGGFVVDIGQRVDLAGGPLLYRYPDGFTALAWLQIAKGPDQPTTIDVAVVAVNEGSRHRRVASVAWPYRRFIAGIGVIYGVAKLITDPRAGRIINPGFDIRGILNDDYPNEVGVNELHRLRQF